MGIQIANEQRTVRLNIKKIKAFVKRISKILRFSSEDSVSITFLSRAKIKQLNRRYLEKNRATDVMAFGYREALTPAGAKKTNRLRKNKAMTAGGHLASRPRKGLYQDYLGDIVICPGVVLENSRIYHNHFFKELILCIIHGLLHLQGYSDRRKSQGLKMQKIQEAVLSKLKLRGLKGRLPHQEMATEFVPGRIW